MPLYSQSKESARKEAAPFDTPAFFNDRAVSRKKAEKFPLGCSRSPPLEFFTEKSWRKETCTGYHGDCYSWVLDV
jgi:hypothetical protein